MAKITDKAMQASPAPRDTWLIESGARGEGSLVGRITPGGERRFYFRYTDSRGERVRLPIGPYQPRGDGRTTFKVQQARDRASEWRALYREGHRDLREYFARQRADAEQAQDDARHAAESARLELDAQAQSAAIERERRISLRKLFERWRDVELKPHIRTDGTRAGRKDAGAYTEDQFERHIFPTLGDHAAADVRKSDVLTILDRVKADGKLRTANVLLSDMKQMFRFAAARELVDRNPLDMVMKRDAGGSSSTRERVLSTEEIAALAGKIPAARLNKRTEAAVWLLIATGARVGELMGTAWGELGIDLKALAAAPNAQDVKVGVVDLMAKTWYMPTTKNEREHTIHLSPFAVTQFESLLALREIGPDGKRLPWVFPNTAGTGPVNVKSFGKQLADRQRPADKRISRRSKKTDSLMLTGGRWTGHDLRRTAATLMAGMGISGDVIDECLNHVIESRVRRTYVLNRRPEEQARAFDLLGAKLAEIVNKRA